MSKEIEDKAKEIYERFYYKMPNSLSERLKDELAIELAMVFIKGKIEALNEVCKNDPVIYKYQEILSAIKKL